MGCIYSDFHGQCQNYHEDDEGTWDGYCIWEDDPDPSVGCEWYESDGNEMEED